MAGQTGNGIRPHSINLARILVRKSICSVGYIASLSPRKGPEIMLKLSIFLLLTLPLAAQTQAFSSTNSSSAASAISDNSNPPLSSSALSNMQNEGSFGRLLGPRREGAPVASFAGTATYVFTDGYLNHSRSLWGFTATPEVNFGKYLGLQADFTQLYMSGIYPGQNR